MPVLLPDRENESFPWERSDIQTELDKAERNLKDMQESYKCAKIYTLLVKQELARISLSGNPGRTT